MLSPAEHSGTIQSPVLSVKSRWKNNAWENAWLAAWLKKEKKMGNHRLKVARVRPDLMIRLSDDDDDDDRTGEEKKVFVNGCG